MAGRAGYGESQRGLKKEKDVRMSNIMAAKGIADAIRTSLGPRGMDKMIQSGDGEVIITNDGATILSQMEVQHPTAKMLVELSKSQDIEAGDGTTSVCVIAGSLLDACHQLLTKGLHPTTIAEAFMLAADEAERILKDTIARPVALEDRPTLINAVVTCLSSKVVSQNSDTLAPIAVDAVLAVMGPAPYTGVTTVDLTNIKIVKQLGGTVDDTELVDGIVFPQGVRKAAGGPTRVEKAKIGLIQFCLSAPKTDMENNVVVSDYAAMDRLLREERKHVLGLCKKIKKAGCNVLLIQKSILRDAYNDLSLHFLAKMGIMCITDIERGEIEFISNTLGLLPVAHVDNMAPEKLGTAELVHEVSMPGSNQKVVKCVGVPRSGLSMTILVRGSNKLVLEEADRSIHDALCVVRSLVKKRFVIAGGGAPEIEACLKLADFAKTVTGMKGYCVAAFAEALEVVPYTLAENAGLNPIDIVTELRKRHRGGEVDAGINVQHSVISNMYEENVIQPLLVNTSALHLATECICMILKIDDLVAVR
ncbi:t-complex protein 1 delta subunit [Pelagophyceae sp. CCMP2097]|nr:t-complex protein 1 delta subunit [Pelagophyceae sp. CCMP2097]